MVKEPNINNYSLRRGDLLVSSAQSAILTKATRNYWYYYIQGVEGRIRKDRLWSAIDHSRLKISYGSDMKKRKKRIDLKL